MNYYPFHLGDYMAHTAHLDPLEDLAYRRMLDLYYLRECALPASVDEIAKLVRMRKNTAEIQSVLNEFFSRDESGDWRHARCELEISRMQDKQTKARASAAASVKARSANSRKSKSERLTDAERTQSERSTDAELPTPTPTPTPTPEEIQGAPATSLAAGPPAKAVARPPLEADPVEANGQPPTPAGAVCRAMRQAGMADTNPGDPRLLALLSQGATEAELVGMAAVAAARGKGWAWALAAVQGQRRDAAAIALAPVIAAPQQPESFRQRDQRLAAERVRDATGGLCHDRKATGEAPRELLPFERGYVAPDTIDGDAREPRRIAS